MSGAEFDAPIELEDWGTEHVPPSDLVDAIAKRLENLRSLGIEIGQQAVSNPTENE